MFAHMHRNDMLMFVTNTKIEYGHAKEYTYAQLVCICAYLCIHTCIYIYTCMYACMYVCIHMCVCVYIYIYIYIYIYKTDLTVTHCNRKLTKACKI